MLLLQQLPAPTTPLPPTGVDPNLVIERLQESAVVLMIVIALTIVAIKVFGPLARAWARKFEGKVGDPELRAEVEHLHEQLADVAPLRERVQELEERIEFTERLLAQRRDQELMPEKPLKELPR